MADSKQGLNGAYYGPAVPPQRAARSVGRGSSCCGPCCLCGVLFKFLLSIVIIVGIIVLVLWLVFRPNQGKVYVETATLEQFNLSNGTLAYNLTMDISIRNPNRRISLYYDYIEAVAYYEGSRFGFTTLQPFYQGHKNTSTIYPAFNGRQVILGSSLDATFNREKSEGFFYIEVDINTRARYKVWFIKSNKYKPRAECKLKLPAPGSSVAFERTKCDVDLF